MDRELDVLVNGPVNATTPDPRARADLVASVCAEIAGGADITDACAACAVSPADFLAWTVDDDDAQTAYSRALRIRARLLADAPIAAAREIRRVREHEHDARVIGAMVGAIKAEAELVATVSERGEPAPRGGNSGPAAAENIVRIVFDPLPIHHQVTATDTQSMPATSEQRKLSDAVPASYVVVDELDA